MEESGNGINRQKNNLYNHMCELLTHLPLSSDAKNRKVDSVKEVAAISEYIKNCVSREKQAEPLPEDQVIFIIKIAQWATQSKNTSPIMVIKEAITAGLSGQEQIVTKAIKCDRPKLLKIPQKSIYQGRSQFWRLISSQN